MRQQTIGRISVNGRIKFGDKVSKFEILQIPTSQKIAGEVIKIL